MQLSVYSRSFYLASEAGEDAANHSFPSVVFKTIHCTLAVAVLYLRMLYRLYVSSRVSVPFTFFLHGSHHS